MSTKLIDVRGPSAAEAEDGAWIVFHRREPDGLEHFIKASYHEGGYQQWGAPTSVLGDNVSAVTLWAEGLREVESMADNSEDEDDEDEPDTKGWEVGDRCDVPGEADRGEIVAILPDTFADGFARAEVLLDIGATVTVSVDDLDILDDEPDAARPY